MPAAAGRGRRRGRGTGRVAGDHRTGGRRPGTGARPDSRGPAAPGRIPRAHVRVHAPVRAFTLEGTLAGRVVLARWHNGRLTGDDRLLTHAQLLADMGTVFVNEIPPARVHATLTGEPAAVMLTLARACDTVTSVESEPA